MQEVANRLAQVLQPEAVDDEDRLLWDFGGKIPRTRIIHEVFNADSRITEVSTTFADVTLARRELPVGGVFKITVTQE